MKRLKSTIALILVLLMGLFGAGCAGGGLSAPSDLMIDENNTLSWTPVRNARSYRIEIATEGGGERAEETTRRTYYSLDGLQEGDYNIRVMAVGGNQNESLSRWSESLAFRKNYESGLVYTLINNETEYMISKVGSAQGAVTIEDEYRGKPVTRIGDAAFRASGKLESIVIGKNVTVIGNNAFYQCPQLTSVSIPESVRSIGTSAFQGCSRLTEIGIPSGVSAISENMFAYCRALKTIEIGEGVESIGNSAFYACSALEGVRFPDSLRSIGSYAFSGSSESVLASVSFGSGIRSIGDYAFSGCGALSEVQFKETQDLVIGGYSFANCDALTEVELPEGLVTLGSYAFYGSDALMDVSLPESLKYVGENTFNGTALYAEQEESDAYGGLIYAGDWLVAATSAAKESLPDTLTPSSSVFKEGMIGIATRALAGTKTLRSFTLPDSVKYIGSSAFADSTLLHYFLTDVNNSALEELGDGAFMGCEQLVQIRLNGKLKTIGSYAFYNCSSVMNNQYYPQWLVPDSVESIGQEAFTGTALFENPDEDGIVYAGNWVVGYGTLSTSDVGLPSTVKGIADWAFSHCADLRSINGLQRVEHLGYGAFAFCENLTYVSGLYRYLEKIEPYTFYKCNQLLTVTLPYELKEIGFAAFAKCEQLFEIDLSETSVETIGDCAFYGCFNVKEVLLGESVTTIGAYAFYGLEQVTELVLPASAREIGERAFAWWIGLQTLTLNEGLESIGSFAFRNCPLLSSVTIPSGVKTIGDYAFYNCVGIKELVLGADVEQIGMCAFYGLGGIGSLVLPASLKEIGSYAFMGCTNLRSLVVEGEIGSIGAHAFYGCGFMTVYAAADAESAAAWDAMWNSSYRPVIWGVTLSEEGYVSSVTVDEGTITYLHATFGFSGPARAGYRFLGWSTDPSAAEAEYDANAPRSVPLGTTLYAVWEEDTADGSTEEYTRK